MNQQSAPNEWTAGFFKIKKLDLDLPSLKIAALEAARTAQERYAATSRETRYKGVTNLFAKYNVFLLSGDPFWRLFKGIHEFWGRVGTNDEPHYIQSWINVYEPGAESFGWHSHWPARHNSWHGYFCVDVDVSRTSYALLSKHYAASRAVHDRYLDEGRPILEHDDEYELIDVVGRDNFLIMSPSCNDVHRNIPWKVAGRPRITIAFDILPGKHVDNNQWINHWIPLP
jgi:hypothetical protein